MKKATLTMLFGVVLLAAGERAQTFTGLITDTMCGASHTMNIKPDEKCVRECVKMDPTKWKYALLVEKNLLVLSDQQAPEKFAGRRVKINGRFIEKNKILNLDRIEVAR
jgi:hypothetical protein